MKLKKIYSERTTVRNYLIIGAITGMVSALAEYFVKLNGDDHQLFIPLVVRAMLGGILIIGSIVVFGILYGDHFTQKTFLYLVIVKSILSTITIKSCPSTGNLIV